jgi:hypothetical protein
VAWRGADVRVRRSAESGYGAIEPQNFVTADDFNEHGSRVLQKMLIN